MTNNLRSGVWIKTKRLFQMYLNIIRSYIIIIITKYLFGLLQYSLHNIRQQCRNICFLNLMFMGPCITIIFWYIIPTRCTSHRVYLIWQLLYMFQASLSPIFRSTKQLHLQHLVTITLYCCLLLLWKSWNVSRIAADNSTV